MMFLDKPILNDLIIGDYRKSQMKVVSGRFGKEQVHFEAPCLNYQCIEHEMNMFLDWLQADNINSGYIKAAIAKFYFVTIHPFDDGNGRFSRMIAERCLADAENTDINLDFIEAALHAGVSRNLFENAIEPSLTKVEALMHQALAQAAKTLAADGLAQDSVNHENISADNAAECKPDVIYVTGGTARSPAIYAKIAGIYPDIPVVVGDHFGSVTAGLTRWAQKLFAKH